MNNEQKNAVSKELSPEEAKTLMESMSLESQKKIFEALVHSGVVNSCHWKCGAKGHEDLPTK